MTTLTRSSPAASDIIDAHRGDVQSLDWLVINRDLNGRVRFIAPESIARQDSMRTTIETIYRELAARIAPRMLTPSNRGFCMRKTAT